MRARLPIAVLAALCLCAGAVFAPMASSQDTSTVDPDAPQAVVEYPADDQPDADTSDDAQPEVAPATKTTTRPPRSTSRHVIPQGSAPVHAPSSSRASARTSSPVAVPSAGGPVQVAPAPVQSPAGAPARAPAAQHRLAVTPHAAKAPQPQLRVPSSTAPAHRRPTHPAASARPYDPRSQPTKVVHTAVAALVVLQIIGGGGLALGAGGLAAGGAAAARGRGGSGRHRKAGSLRGAKVKHLKGGVEGAAFGDRSWTWRWPATATVDALSSTLPPRLARWSPLMARITMDGSYLRAMLGSLSLLGLLAGAVLGVVAVNNTGGAALPPAATLTVAIAILGVLDAAAGLTAVLVFVAGVILLGGIDSADSVRTLLGLCGLWFVVPLCAGAIRPLRRPPVQTVLERVERAADFVIASLMGAWVAQKIVLTLPGLAGQDLAIAHYANAAAYAILAALAARLAAETIASHWFPGRLANVHADGVPWPSKPKQILAAVFRTTLFVFVAVVAVHAGWQLVVGSVLFFIPQVLKTYERDLPKRQGLLMRVVPEKLVKAVVLLLVTSLLAAWVLHDLRHSPHLIEDSFVVLALPGFIVSVAGAFAEEKPKRPLQWRHVLAGAAVLALGVAQVLGLLV